MPEQKHLRFLLGVVYAGLGALGLWLGLTYLLPWLLPLLIALALAALLERPVGALTARLNFPRWVAAAVCTVSLGAAALGLLGLILWRLWYEGALFLDRLPALLAALPNPAAWWEDWLYRLLTAAPVSMQAYLTGLLSDLAAQGSTLPARLSGWAVRWAADLVAALPDFFLLVFTSALATYFVCASRPALLAFFRRQLPAPWRPRVRMGYQRLRVTFGQWLRAQGLLMLITFGELAVGFLLLGVDYFLLAAALVAVVDALPVFGTGTVLLPWAAVALLGGNWYLGAGLGVLYWVVTTVRSLLEPKLVGDRAGLPPLCALMAMYVGFKAWGVAGMVLFPILFLFLKELHDCGFFRLWRD